MRAGLKGTVNILPIVIKGIVHSKIVFLSLFAHSHVVPNLYSFLSCAEHKIRYFEACFQNSSWSTLNLIVEKHAMEVPGDPQLLGFTHSSK